MEQLILHLFGDYVSQSDWMANNKTKSTWAAFCHATVYSLPFLFIASWSAWLVIWSTHLLIDRYRLARYVVWLKNVTLSPVLFQQAGANLKILPGNPFHWENCKGTGYPADSPPWLAVWLLIAADNTFHLIINYAAIRWL